MTTFKIKQKEEQAQVWLARNILENLHTDQQKKEMCVVVTANRITKAGEVVTWCGCHLEFNKNKPQSGQIIKSTNVVSKILRIVKG